jgi:NADPH-dependent ferric siderophore reductase
VPLLLRHSTPHPPTVRELVVARTTDITPALRRITLTGEELGAFTRDGFAQLPFESTGFDDDVRLIFPYPGDSEPILPAQGDGKLIVPKDPRPLVRAYTIRRFDKAAGELDIEFAKHGTGIATTWAYRCVAGDRINVLCHMSSASLPHGVDWTLILGDDTAIPAISRWLEEAPEGTRAKIFIEVASARHEIRTPTKADAEVTWLHRGSAPGGSTSLILDALRNTTWPAGTPYVWAAGEALTLKPLRRFLKDEKKIPKENLEVIGYWRVSEVATLADDPAIPDLDQAKEDPYTVLHELGELLPPYALRVAATLDLPGLIARGTRRASDLATASGSDPRAIGKLLRYLQSIEIVEGGEHGEYSLTEVGQEMTEDFMRDYLDLNGVHAPLELSFAGLLHSVRTGESSYRSVHGIEYSDLLSQPDFQPKHVEWSGTFARFLSAELFFDPVFAGVRRLTIIGDGAGAYAQDAVSALPEATATIIGLPTYLRSIHNDLVVSVTDESQLDRILYSEQSVFEAPPPSDMVLVVRELDQHADAEAELLLRKVAASGARVVVIESPLDETTLDEHEHEHDLKMLCVYGTGHRSENETQSLFAAAGLVVKEARTIAWANRLYELQIHN